jgi:hypothetical protein
VELSLLGRNVYTLGVGYDFSFARLATRPAAFPCKMPKDFGEKDLRAFEDVKGLKRVVESKGFAPVRSIAMEFWWDAPDGGSINLDLGTASIGWLNVDTHTHWRFVLEVFTHLHSVYADLVIVDPQTATIYDAESFTPFIELKYTEETDRVRRLAACCAAKPKT